MLRVGLTIGMKIDLAHISRLLCQKNQMGHDRLFVKVNLHTFSKGIGYQGDHYAWYTPKYSKYKVVFVLNLIYLSS